MRTAYSLSFCALAAALAGALAVSCSENSPPETFESYMAEISKEPSKADSEAAAKGDRDACAKLGFHYFIKASASSSKEDAEADYSKAFKLFSQAADAGDVRSRIQLGVMHEGGLGVKQDSILAARCYRMASDTGSPDGQNALAAFWCRIGANAEDAEALARKAIAQKPDRAAFQLTLAAILYSEGKLEEGSKAFDSVKASHGGDLQAMQAAADFYASRGAELLQNGALEDSANTYARALEFRPSDLQLLELYGASCVKLGDPKRAAPLFDAAIQKSTKSPEPYLARAAFRRASGDSSGAFDDLFKAVEAAPSDVNARLAFGSLCAETGRKDLALLQFSEALSLDPVCAEALWLRANLKTSSGSFAAALEDYDALLALEPSNGKALVAKAKSLSALGQHGKAAAVCGKAIKLNPSDAFAYVCRANALMSLGDLKAADADCSEALKLSSEIPFGYATRGRIRAALGQEQEALEDFSSAMKLDPSDASSLFFTASIMLKQGKSLGVMHLLRKPIVEGDYALLLLRARAELLSKEWAKAVADLEKAASIDGEKPDAWNLKSFALLEARRFQEAEAAATRAIDLGDKDKGAYFVRGRARMELGRPERAISDFDSLVEISPSDAGAYQLRGAAKSLAGRYAAALADFQRASSLDPSAPCKLDLSEALLLDKQPEKAYDVASQVLASKPEQLHFKAVALYLKCVSGLVSKQPVGDELAAFDEALKAYFSPEWSSDSFENWLKGAKLPPELKASLEELTSKLKAKGVSAKP